MKKVILGVAGVCTSLCLVLNVSSSPVSNDKDLYLSTIERRKMLHESMPKIRGIDVSRWQGDINWQEVKDDGIEFAMIRAGYGDKLEYEDPKFDQNIINAQNAGIKCGIYWFSYAQTVEEARREAHTCIEVIGRYKLEYPIVFDFEADSMKDSPAYGNRELITDMAIAFIEEITSAGYYPMIYANGDFIRNYFELDRIANYDLWFANPNNIAPEIPCHIWQNSFTGSVAGIRGYVDLNYSYIDYAEKIERLGRNYPVIGPVINPDNVEI